MRETLTIVASFIAMEVGRTTIKINTGIRVPIISALKRKATNGPIHSNAGDDKKGDDSAGKFLLLQPYLFRCWNIDPTTGWY